MNKRKLILKRCKDEMRALSSFIKTQYDLNFGFPEEYLDTFDDERLKSFEISVLPKVRAMRNRLSQGRDIPTVEEFTVQMYSITGIAVPVCNDNDEVVPGELRINEVQYAPPV